MDRNRDKNTENGMNATSSDAGEAAASLGQQAGETIERSRAALADVQTMVTEKTRECIRTTDNYVRDNPWRAVGIAAGVGLVVGLLIARR